MKLWKEELIILRRVLGTGKEAQKELLERLIHKVIVYKLYLLFTNKGALYIIYLEKYTKNTILNLPGNQVNVSVGKAQNADQAQ